jgi:hypothetical protein
MEHERIVKRDPKNPRDTNYNALVHIEYLYHVHQGREWNTRILALHQYDSQAGPATILALSIVHRVVIH